MTRRRLTIVVGLLMIVVIVAVGATLPVQYAAMGPGPTYNTLGSVDGTQVVVIDGRKPLKTSGHLNMTTVSVYDHLTIFDGLYRWVAGDQAVIPREQVFPPGKTDKQVAQEDAAQFQSSQNHAVTAALTHLGYGTVVVQQLTKASPSAGLLAPGDTITALNGTPTKSPDALHAVLAKIKPGTPVTVTAVHAGKPVTRKVTSTKPQSGGGAALGVFITVVAKAPFTVTVDVKNVGGPSAGLMFALGILEKLQGDVTGGRFIAGTGEIDQYGQVSEIGGIPLKMIAARRAGATAFLVPAANCKEAKEHAQKGMQMLKVTTLDDALAGLADLRAGKPAPSC